MSNPEGAADPKQPGGAAPAGLQFDRAVFSSPKKFKCATCNQGIHDAYYRIEEKILCNTCRESAESMMTGGSGSRRFIRALIFGSIAAAFGSGLYWAILAATGYEIGLIAIVVGMMVGAAVKHGADSRGGWVYQSLAIFLTYTAIVSAYVPLVIAEFSNQRSADAMMADIDDEDLEAASAGKATPANAPAPGSSAAAVEINETEPLGAVDFIVVLCMAIGFIYAIPFLAGFQNIIGLFIIGIGLHQAWSLNKRMQSEITGPFNVPPSAPAGQEASPSGA